MMTPEQVAVLERKATAWDLLMTSVKGPDEAILDAYGYATRGAVPDTTEAALVMRTDAARAIRR